ncbi:MAG TPA: hypothetical protein H9903_10510 [Candidatus Aquabacterium excrementipullorum]|nr:hypothetical protein [Candidatus Aquabacterium excrementipullorum]
MSELLKDLISRLEALNGSGNVRPDGQAELNGIRVTAAQLLEQVEAPATVDPVEDRLAALGDVVGELSHQVAQLVSLANQAGAAQATAEG